MRRNSDKATMDRRGFIGGSDARVIMSPDAAALIRLWREKRGEADPEDLSDNLVVSSGLLPRRSIGLGMSAMPGGSSPTSSAGFNTLCTGTWRRP
jgi:hypothetical protein